MTALSSESGISPSGRSVRFWSAKSFAKLLAVAVVDDRGLVAPLCFALRIGQVANDGRVHNGTCRSQRHRQHEGCDEGELQNAAPARALRLARRRATRGVSYAAAGWFACRCLTCGSPSRGGSLVTGSLLRSLRACGPCLLRRRVTARCTLATSRAARTGRGAGRRCVVRGISRAPPGARSRFGPLVPASAGAAACIVVALAHNTCSSGPTGGSWHAPAPGTGRACGSVRSARV
jgi:hypothetical protein